MFRKLKYNVIASKAKQSRIDCFVVILFAMTGLPLNTLAQQYKPPPLFETPTYSPAPKTAPTNKGEQPRTASSKTAPKPKEKPDPKPAFKVRDLSKQQNSRTLNKKKVAPPPNYRGVVKGPKTMPSAPANSVESEVLFEAPEGQNIPLLYQQPKTQPKITPKTRAKPSTKPVTEPKTVAEKIPSLPAFKTPKDGVLQSTLYFVSVTEELSDTNQKTIKHLIIPELRKNDKKRLLIEAYASSQNNVLNGDRRISLSRALNIRRFLIENGIDSSRLDVRAFGANTDTQPIDRVELLIIS